MAATLDHHAVFADALKPARSARCDQLAAQVWITPKRMIVVAHAVADCIIRTIFSRPELQALEPIRNATARADARRALERKAVPALDEAALRMLDKLDQLEFFTGEQAFGELFSASGLVAMCLIRAERAGIPHIGERLAEMLAALVAHQERTVTEADAQVLDDRAYAAFDARQLRTARTNFAQAGAAYIALGRIMDAFRTLSSAGSIAGELGDQAGALATVDAALALPLPPDDRNRVVAAMTRGMILDALDRVEAVDAWVAASKLQTTPAGVAFCMAHAYGAKSKHHDIALDDLVVILDRAGPLTSAQRAGVLGAAGQSAGTRNVSLLAQAVVLMCETVDAWTASTTRFWALLIEHVGYTKPGAVQLIGVGWVLTLLHKQSPDYNALLEAVRGATERCAQARGITPEQLRRLAVTGPSAQEFLAGAARDLRAAIAPGQWVPERATAPARPVAPRAGAGRVSRHHPRWANGQYATYFLERSDGTWVAIALQLVDRPEGWLVIADTNEAAVEMRLLLEPVAATDGSLRFRPVGWSRRRGEADEAAALKNVTLVTSLLDAADLGVVADPPAPPSAPLPCGLDEVYAVDVPMLDYTIRHELNARIPITGLARSTIRDRAFALVVTSFGNSDPALGHGFDDHVDLSHPRKIEHERFSLAYPATWALNAVSPTDLDSPSSLEVRAFSGGGGGNSTAAHCMVTLYAGTVAELDRLEGDLAARWSARIPSRGGAFRPGGEYALGAARAFVQTFEHPFQDGFAIAALVRSDAVLATVTVFWNVLKTHPQREQMLRDAQQPARDIIASFELRAAPASAAARVLN